VYYIITIISLLYHCITNYLFKKR